jgi:hypothetical protein
MKIVYIAHPISGVVEGNLKAITEIAREIMFFDTEVIPFAPYFFDCHVLNDSVPEERQRGIRNDREYFNRGVIDEVWVYGPRISNGMKAEIDLAHSLEIPVFIKDKRLHH